LIYSAVAELALGAARAVEVGLVEIRRSRGAPAVVSLALLPAETARRWDVLTPAMVLSIIASSYECRD
jgi:hypothetical protein